MKVSFFNPFIASIRCIFPLRLFSLFCVKSGKSKFLTIVLIALTFFHNALVSREAEPRSDLKIWFTKPATDWNEALPVGNGRLGAMVFGGVFSERLQLNEESVWTGEDRDFSNPKALASLPKVRQLLFEGRYTEAQKLAQQDILADRPRDLQATYQTLGNLYLDFAPGRRVEEYRRELDLETAVAKVSCRIDGVKIRRETFASAPDQALVTGLIADRSAALSFVLRLSRPGEKAAITATDSSITMSEHVGDGVGVRMVTRLTVHTAGGAVTAIGDSLLVDKADSVTIYLTAATDYHGSDPFAMSDAQMRSVTKKSFSELKKSHIADFQSYFKRVDLDLGVSDGRFFPTDSRIAAMQNGYVDLGLIALYFQFGRYLLISSSRPSCLPANLQGIWAEGLYPPWSADYHININIQMNYWPAEVTNLAELHVPFLEFIDALRPDARKTAREVYGCRGIVAHYTTDLWHFTEPEGRAQYGMWPMGIAWSCQHLWEHYAFNGDVRYLRDFAYPIMKEAAEFCLDWLVTDPRTGYLVSGPSISPENRFRTADGDIASVVMGPTMDHMIIRDLLENTLAATEVLGVDKTFRKKIDETLANLTPAGVGSDGRLMEWSEEFDEPEPGHRHISHLFGLHPGKQITKHRDKRLFAAARRTIDYRLAHGGGHTGWSRAWIINFFARLGDGEQAYENLLALLCKSTLPNLFDTHPPFQIDGNFGGTAGIAEMLLQSHGGEIELLPALPDAWHTGRIHGLRARGNFEVDLDWHNGKLQRARLLSKSGNTCRIGYSDRTVTLKTEAGKTFNLDANLDVMTN